MQHTITHLADYLEEFSAQLESRGVIVHWAKDANDFNNIVLDILQSHGVRKMVKSKSMLTEECAMKQSSENYFSQAAIDTEKRLFTSGMDASSIRNSSELKDIALKLAFILGSFASFLSFVS